MKFVVAMSLLFAGLATAAATPNVDVTNIAAGSCDSGCAGVCGDNGYCIVTNGDKSYNFPCGDGTVSTPDIDTIVLAEADKGKQCTGHAGQACTGYTGKNTQCPV